MRELPDPKEPVALFEGPSVRMFRGWALVALIFGSVCTGALLHAGVRELYEEYQRGRAIRAEPSATTTAPAVRGSPTLPAGVLEGPGGPVRVPPNEPVLINVWLEGCRDCMPAFEAWRAINGERRLRPDIPIINVAYGSASLSFAEAYGLRSRLVFDRGGSAVVGPLGIGTFTTLIVDSAGNVRMRDRPDAPGFVDRVNAAFTILQSAPSARPMTTSGPSSTTAGAQAPSATIGIDAPSEVPMTTER